MSCVVSASCVSNATLHQQFAKNRVHGAQRERASAGPREEERIGRPVTEVLAEAKNFRLPDEDNPEVQPWLREMGVGDADK